MRLVRIGIRGRLRYVFFATALVILAFTQYYSHNKIIELKKNSIISKVDATHELFRSHFAKQNNNNLQLIKAMTSDRKFHTSLWKEPNKSASFAIKIADTVNADCVFILDENTKLHGLWLPTNDGLMNDRQTARIKNTIDRDDIKGLLLKILHSDKKIDPGKKQQIVILNNELFNFAFHPIKKSLHDSTALGIIGVGIKLDDAWISQLPNWDKDVNMTLFVDGHPVASNMANKHRGTITKAALGMNSKTAVIRLNEEKHILFKGEFANLGTQASYVFAASLDRAMVPFNSLLWQVFAAGLTVLAIGAAIVIALTNHITFPICRLLDATREVTDGNYDCHVDKISTDEVGELTKTFNLMVKGLKEREQIRNLFGKYVHPSIVSDIMKNPDSLLTSGARRKQTLLFCDIQGFTTLAENMDAEQTVAFLNDFLSTITKELSAHEGILDKYLGDGLMAFWGEPFNKDNHALLACRAALAMQASVFVRQAEWSSQGLPQIHMRTGVATGNVVVGNIGSEQARDYTCIGNTVNLCSRLEGVNKLYGSKIIIDEQSKIMAGDEIVTRELDTVQVKGREGGTPIYELLGLQTDVSAQTLELIDRYAQALKLYRAGNFSIARDAFKHILQNTPDDIPSKLMLERCLSHIDNPVKNWTAIEVLDSK
ncbi:MAG: HAMP domain-containing protein [bacterium]|nr:HAMP domain-containing protein [bacterium]